MSLQRRQLFRLAAGIAALPTMGRFALGGSYPTRPVTMVVPYPAGGPGDTVGRILAAGMHGSLGQPIIIENMAGASGSIGVGRVARAAPDGYTFVLGDLGSHVLNGAMLDLDYDVLKDFEPVALVSSEPLLIIARKGLAANDLEGFIAWLKANPEKATQGTGGAAGISSVSGLFFQKETGARFRLVPYRAGVSGAMLDLAAERIDFMIDMAANCLPHLRSGEVKAYAVTTDSRLASAPNVPTVGEAGLRGFEFSFWRAVWAPKGTPAGIVAKLNDSVRTALSNAETRQRLAGLEVEIFPPERQSPEALAAFQRSEIEKWWPLIRAAGLKSE
jgi:tripartite-type tricarboxylate transporter receptor subunit TctC